MAKPISQQTIDQVRGASDIVEIIGGVLPLKRRGANFFALCPFHQEKSPSFAVNPTKQIFHCYGCHKGGNVFTFLQEYEGLTFVEAVQRLAHRSGIPLEFEKDPEYQRAKSLKDSLYRLHEQVTQYWHRTLLEGPEAKFARDYLERRGVSGEAIKEFRLGYAPPGWEDTVTWAQKQGYDLELVEKGGLVTRRDRGGYYDRFRGRLIFPISDEQGRVIGFSGRILEETSNAPKYLNSPETPLFRKSRVIYGLDKTKRGLLNAKSAVICEGQLDLIACYRAGVPNVVAPQGSALTAEHARILRRYVDEVVLCFDSDSSGEKAAVRALDELLSSGLSIRVAIVPAPHDPDSYVKEVGGSAFQSLIASAVSFFDFYLDLLVRNHDVGTDRGRKAIVAAMADAVRKADDQVLGDRYAQRTAMRLGVRPEAVRYEFRKKAGAGGATSRFDPGRTDETSTEAVAPPAAQEMWLIKLLFAGDGVPWASQVLGLQWIRDQTVREILSRKFELEAEGRESGVDALLEELSDERARSLLTEAVSDEREIPQPEQQLVDLMRRLRNQHADRQLRLLTRKLSEPDCTEDEIHGLLAQQDEWRALKQQPIQVPEGDIHETAAPEPESD